MSQHSAVRSAAVIFRLGCPKLPKTECPSARVGEKAGLQTFDFWSSRLSPSDFQSFPSLHPFPGNLVMADDSSYSLFLVVVEDLVYCCSRSSSASHRLIRFIHLPSYRILRWPIRFEKRDVDGGGKSWNKLVDRIVRRARRRDRGCAVERACDRAIGGLWRSRGSFEPGEEDLRKMSAGASNLGR
ncbi:unnamed protein product [Calypogeia fissa]